MTVLYCSTLKDRFTIFRSVLKVQCVIPGRMLVVREKNVEVAEEQDIRARGRGRPAPAAALGAALLLHPLC